MNPTISCGVITEVPDGIVINIHLQPRASKTEICGFHGDELKVRVTSPPVDDAANRLCTEFFAKIFKTAKTSVAIISGHKSRHKRLHIPNVTMKDATDLINARILTMR